VHFRENRITSKKRRVCSEEAFIEKGKRITESTPLGIDSIGEMINQTADIPSHLAEID
jgi:hypothetical protein